MAGGKFKNQAGLRKAKGLPPNVTKKDYYWTFKVETRPHSKKRGVIRKAL
jgi:hypothetical protein